MSRRVLLLLPALLLVLGWDLASLYRSERANAALQRGEPAGVESLDAERAAFARAYALAQRGEFRQALQEYARAAQHGDPEVGFAVKYNMAGVYLEYALALGAEETNELAVPLIELAKQNYKELLREDPALWDAKYNLERALALLPDSGELEPADELMPERSRRAAVAAESMERLP